MIARAAQFDMPALALTDRDGLAGAIRFTKACVGYGIAPIIGINFAIVLRHFNRTKWFANYYYKYHIHFSALIGLDLQNLYGFSRL